MDLLTRFNMHEWEAEAKQHAGEEAFAQPLLDAIAEVRRTLELYDMACGRQNDSAALVTEVTGIVYDDRLTDSAVRMLLAHALDPPWGVRDGSFPR